MCEILCGAGGAYCQLCTASLKYLKDINMVRAGFPIYRTISDAKELFPIVDRDDYLSLTSSLRLGITNEPISERNIMARPLRSYTCVFRWHMLLIHQLNAGKSIWSPTSKLIETSKKSVVISYSRKLVKNRSAFQ